MAEERKAQRAYNREEESKMDMNDIASTFSSSLMVEDVHTGVDEAGHVVRRDAFKGFSSEQRRKAYEENLLLIKQKRCILLI